MTQGMSHHEGRCPSVNTRHLLSLLNLPEDLLPLWHEPISRFHGSPSSPETFAAPRYDSRSGKIGLNLAYTYPLPI
jgi:hypothetical protein